MGSEMHDVMIISDDVVGEKMAGPGIRAWELARCLSRHFKVILAIPDYSYKSNKTDFFTDLSFDVVSYSLKIPSFIQSVAEKSRIILTQGFILSKFPGIKSLPVHLICDLYVPFPLENLFVHKAKIPDLKDREFIHHNDLRVFNEQLIYGDHFLCASQRQKDLFIGSLMSLNRVNPQILDSSPSLEDLISVVPFGISGEDAADVESKVVRKRFPQIKEDDILLLWGGVLSNWFDPVTLIKAFRDALEVKQNLKLFFLSTKHANPLTPPFEMAREAVRISDELDLTGKFVFFNKDWVAYSQRGAYFRDADIGVSIHKTHFETYFAFRTRILDYLKHGLPIICTEGDYFAELVEREKLGIIVGSERRDELKNAIVTLASDSGLRTEIRVRIEKIREYFDWERVTEPLVRYCRKVLAGEIKKKSLPSRKDIAFICSLRRESFLKKTAKKYIWLLFQRLPLSSGAKIRRLFKFMS